MTLGSLRLRIGTKVHSDLLEENEGEDGVRPEPDKGRNVALEKGQRSLRGGEPDEVQGSLELSGLGVHGSSLQDVQRLRHGGRDRTLEENRNSKF